jgi:hypothetical protein
MSSLTRPIAVYYEHPDWFRPLFAELERRDLPHVRIDAHRHSYDPTVSAESGYGLLFNRMSPSAYLRSVGHSLFFTLGYLAELERRGVRVINGRQSYTYETSKALQLQLLDKLGLDAPRTRVINHYSVAPAAAQGLRFPVVVKANVGGSGAGIARYDTPEALAEAALLAEIDMGPDGSALVQEYIPARDKRITRVETLGGRYLYAINVYTDGDSFNLCPADICRTADGAELTRSACPVDAPKSGLTVEATTPSPEVIAAVERIAAAACLDVGGIELMVDDRDGRLLYYDINALSNFVADARNVIGFDPHERLVDFLLQEART